MHTLELFKKMELFETLAKIIIRVVSGLKVSKILLNY